MREVPGVYKAEKAPQSMEVLFPLKFMSRILN